MKDRLTAVHSHLMSFCDFTSTTKHAATFCKLLFNDNFRSIYTYDKKSMTNKRVGMTYDCLLELPTFFKSWMLEERRKHEPWFKRAQPGFEPYPPSTFDPKAWKNRFRAIFTETTTDLWKKTIAVRKDIYYY